MKVFFGREKKNIFWIRLWRVDQNKILRRLWNRDGWVIDILPNTNPQRYRKRKKNPTSPNISIPQIQDNIEYSVEVAQFHKEFQEFSEKAGKFGYEVFLKRIKHKENGA
ncbi:MAG: hypothetical protein FWC34_00175 [Bacteroidetes bacterium]|nr:hypothetical protein [Bacteroidota bacterium]